MRLKNIKFFAQIFACKLLKYVPIESRRCQLVQLFRQRDRFNRKSKVCLGQMRPSPKPAHLSISQINPVGRLWSTILWRVLRRVPIVRLTSKSQAGVGTTGLRFEFCLWFSVCGSKKNKPKKCFWFAKFLSQTENKFLVCDLFKPNREKVFGFHIFFWKPNRFGCLFLPTPDHRNFRCRSNGKFGAEWVKLKSWPTSCPAGKRKRGHFPGWFVEENQRGPRGQSGFDVECDWGLPDSAGLDQWGWDRR